MYLFNVKFVLTTLTIQSKMDFIYKKNAPLSNKINRKNSKHDIWTDF